jgi:DNA-binding response OmpR family regulator
VKKILLASRSEMFLRTKKSLLKYNALGLFSAKSGAETLKLLEDYQIDLVIADVELDDMSGETLCSLVRKNEHLQSVPTILLCNKSSESLLKARESGASIILEKPADPTKLLETIGSFLEFNIIRSKRVELRVKVLCKKDQLEFFCLSHDISITGLLIETEHHLALKSRVVCSFSLPGSRKIEAEGEIIRPVRTLQSKNLYGVKFMNLPMSEQEAIDAYVISTASSEDRAAARQHFSAGGQFILPQQ